MLCNKILVIGNISYKCRGRSQNHGRISGRIQMAIPMANDQWFTKEEQTGDALNEILSQCYEVPAVSYGIDSMFSWHRNKHAHENNALILSLVYHTTHVMPISGGQLKYKHVRRLNLDGFEMASYLLRLLEMKYPAHLNAITLTCNESTFHNHNFIVCNYIEELNKWNTRRKVKEASKLKKPERKARRVNTIEKKNGASHSDTLSDNVVGNQPRSIKSYKPYSGVSLAHSLNDVERKHGELLQKKTFRSEKRQAIGKRHTLVSRERMRIISLLPSDEKRTDEFCKDDRDWDVHKKIGLENDGDSAIENEKLMEHENILKHHQT
uniref:Uncharacterized protein n=1 Tax=Glossina palpalis gambiensis TaxID=67801 RepID=A0A1B0BCN0_9MUSC